MYEIESRAAAAVPVQVPLRDFRTDLDAMAARLSPRTRMVFVNTPTTRPAAWWPAASLNVSWGCCRRASSWCWTRPTSNSCATRTGPTVWNCLKAGRPVVGLRTFSKAYGLAGLRIGYGLMPVEVAEVLTGCASLQRQSSGPGGGCGGPR